MLNEVSDFVLFMFSRDFVQRCDHKSIIVAPFAPLRALRETTSLKSPHQTAYTIVSPV